MSLYEEVKLYESAAERDKITNLAELFAVLNTLECLEKAYIRDLVSRAEYTSQCSKLLAQYKSAFKLVHNEHPDVESFTRKYKLNCPAALDRIKEGLIKDDNTSKCIADTVTLFITTMDKLKLEIRAKDELYGELKDLVDTMNRMNPPPSDPACTEKPKFWLDVLTEMRASDTLSDEQAREMVFDIEQAFNAFNRSLHSL